MDTIIISATEPSIGQVDYLKRLAGMRTVQKPAFMKVEFELKVFDELAVEKSIAFFLERHESLRTVFPLLNNEIKQVVLPLTDKRFQLEYVDVPDDELSFITTRQIYFEKAATVFSDIEQGPLIKLFMFRTSEKYFFSMLIHHIIFDEWSRGIAEEELTVIYNSYLQKNDPPLQPLTFALKDYCARQNAWLIENKEMVSDFWKNKLRDFQTPFDLSGFQKMFAQRKSVAVQPCQTYDYTELSAILDKPDASSYAVVVADELFAEIKNWSADNNITMSPFIYASFLLLQHVYTGKKKILIHGLIADRFLPEYQPIIGCLLGSMYIAMTIKENTTISDFIKETNDVIIDVVVNRWLIHSHTYLQMPEWLRNASDMFINYISKQQEFPAHQYILEQHEEEDAIHFPIYAQIVEYNNALALTWRYNKYLFNREMIEDLVQCYRELLQLMIFHPGKTIREIAASYRSSL